MNKKTLLFLFKKKPFLKDLLPGGYTDIHSHLLPGIDDGAKNVEESEALVSALSGFGVSSFITTPHIMNSVWENSPETINNALNLARQRFSDSGKTVSIRAAAEYMIDSNFPKLVQEKKLLTLKGNHVLVEMSYLSAPIQLYEIIFDMQVAGYIPVLAHPERYGFLAGKHDEYRKLKNAGCKFQLNLLSATGYYGEGVAKAAKELLNLGLIDFTGSDVHHQNHIRAFDKRILFDEIAAMKSAMQNNSEFA